MKHFCRICIPLVLLISACSSSPKEAELFPIQPSEFKEASFTTLWEVGGEEDETFQFSSSQLHAKFLSSTHLVLSEYNLLNMKKMNRSDGSIVGTYAGKGKGPGELSGFSRPSIKGDTLYHYDFSQSKWSMYHVHTTRHIMDIVVPRSPDGGYISLIYLVNDSVYYSIINRNFFASNADDEAKDKSMNLARLHIGSESMVPLNRFETYPPHVERTSNSVTVYTNPMAPSTLFAFDRFTNRLYTSWSSAFSIAGFHLMQSSDHSLDTLIHITQPVKPEALTRERINKNIESYSESYQEAVGKMTFPETSPVIRSMFVDLQSQLWVEAFEQDEARKLKLYWIFNKDGQLVRKLALPKDLIITDVDGTTMLAYDKDENGFMKLKYLKLAW